mmetsp:Transcript_15804/g.25725  ORF Transcript_15804/g.25725 Transcript_15804/m.25725 type:complete len:307 (+) Transcript_15804:51-971(+)
MFAFSGLPCDVSEVCPSSSHSLRQEMCQQLSMLLQSANCLFPQAALFLDLKDVCRLSSTSRDIIPEAWENKIWHDVANSSCTGFRRFRFSNLDKPTIRNFLKYVVYSTPVFDTEAIVVDSTEVANTLVQFARKTFLEPSVSVPRSLSGLSARSFLTRFRFDEDSLEEHAMDSSELAFSLPAVFELRGDQCFLELTLQENGLNLSVHNYSKAELGKDDEEDDEDAEPVALSKPLRVQLCSISSSVVIRNEYILTFADVDVPSHGICDLPSATDLMTKALAEGFACMVSVTEMTWDELDELRAEERCV